jgi:hypothetical protein
VRHNPACPLSRHWLHTRAGRQCHWRRSPPGAYSRARLSCSFMLLFPSLNSLDWANAACSPGFRCGGDRRRTWACGHAVRGRRRGVRHDRDQSGWRLGCRRRGRLHTGARLRRRAQAQSTEFHSSWLCSAFASCPTYLALAHHADLGDAVYILGGGCGVGHLAIQKARTLGVRTIISSGGSEASCALAKASGATHVLDYRKDDVAAEIAKLTRGKAVDLVYDTTYNEASFVATVGNLSPHTPTTTPLCL